MVRMNILMIFGAGIILIILILTATALTAEGTKGFSCIQTGFSVAAGENYYLGLLPGVIGPCFHPVSMPILVIAMKLRI
jgi:hypothetical protein